MKLTIEATDQLVELDGVLVRLWEGTTESGLPCLVYVYRIAVPIEVDQAEFLASLGEEVDPPVLLASGPRCCQL